MPRARCARSRRSRRRRADSGADRGEYVCPHGALARPHEDGCRSAERRALGGARSGAREPASVAFAETADPELLKLFIEEAREELQKIIALPS